jgi:hypothetical protein
MPWSRRWDLDSEGIARKVCSNGDPCHLQCLTLSSLEEAEELCHKRKPEKALPYLRKGNGRRQYLDAFIQGASLQHLPEAVGTLQTAENNGAFSCDLTIFPSV